MHVYLVCQGEFGEGQLPLGIRSSYGGARILLARHMPSARIERVKDGQWKATANGVDEIWIYRMAEDQ